MPSYRFRSEKFFSRGFKDLAVSFEANPNTEDFSTKNENAIKQSIRNLILTVFGERPYNLMDQESKDYYLNPLTFSPQKTLRDEISNTIQRLEPRVEVENIDVNSLMMNIVLT